MIAALLLMAASPGPAAEALGIRLARAGTLATLLPLLAGRDRDDLIAAHPELSSVERERLRAVADRTIAAGRERIVAAMGSAYAARLAVADLKSLVAAAEAPAQRRFRTALPGAMAQALGGLGGVDIKKDIADAFCRDTGKLCAASR